MTYLYDAGIMLSVYQFQQSDMTQVMKVEYITVC